MNEIPQQDNQTDQNQNTTPTPPQPQPPVDPMQPVAPDGGMGMGSPTPNNPPKSKMMVIIIIILVVLLGAGLAYWLLKPEENKTTTNNTSQNDTEMVTTELTNEISGSPTVAVTHPASWQVTEDNSTEQGAVSGSKTITSAKGNALELSYSDLGVGSAGCEPDDQEFTLTQKLATASSDVYFTEYSLAATASESASIAGIQIDTSTFDVAGSEVGATGTNVCDNRIGYYSKVGGNGTEDTVYVKITSPDSVDPQNTLYADIADDTEFIAMLQSLKVTTN